MHSHADAIERSVELIRNAQRVVAFTGAGVSTASGIPDFRSASDGLWAHQDPLKVASLNSFRQDPTLFFNWVHPILALIQDAKPNATHLALAALQRANQLEAIITQNIDGLHTAAGNTSVYELHGHLRTATCTHCFKKYDAAPLLSAFRETCEIPLCNCQAAGSVIKPDIILFGEQLPRQTVQQAQKTIIQADLLLVVGSSLRVAPASEVPFTAIQYGAKVIIINYEPTPADATAAVVIHADVNEILPQIVHKGGWS